MVIMGIHMSKKIPPLSPPSTPPPLRFSPLVFHFRATRLHGLVGNFHCLFMCRRARNPPPLGSVFLWCMMYAQKGNLMFIHDFQGNASAKPSDFLLRNKTTWDWDFSLKAPRPILQHLFLYLSFSLSLLSHPPLIFFSVFKTLPWYYLRQL